MRHRSAFAALVVASLVPYRVSAAVATCPNERPGASDEDNLGACLGDAREAKRAGQLELAAAAYRRTFVFARNKYQTDKAGATPEWFTTAGEQVIYYGTEGCSLARSLSWVQARSMLDACIDLLELYSADLAANQASESRSNQVAQKRLAELRPLQASLPPITATSSPRPTPADRAAGTTSPEQDTLVDLPPVRQPASVPPPPHRLHIGLGISAALVGGSIASLVAGELLGRKVATDLGDSTTDQLHTARTLYTAGAVGLGLSLAAAAVFTGLLIHRHGKRPRPQGLTFSPSRTGFSIGVTRSF